MQGFEEGPEPYPHLWVETADHHIDLGPHLLPYGSPFPLVPMPALAWDKAAPLPAALGYAPIERVAADAPFSIDAPVADRAARFVACCFDLGAEQEAGAFPHWIATSPGSLDAAASAGDRWAQAAGHFARVTLQPGT